MLVMYLLYLVLVHLRNQLFQSVVCNVALAPLQSFGTTSEGEEKGAEMM